MIDNFPVRIHGNFAALKNRLAHIDGRAVHPAVAESQRDAFYSAISLDRDWIFVRDAVFIREPREASDAIAAHFSTAAVGVVHFHFEVGGS